MNDHDWLLGITASLFISGSGNAQSKFLVPVFLAFTFVCWLWFQSTHCPKSILSILLCEYIYVSMVLVTDWV